MPPIERYNRVNRGFDPAAKSPIQVPGLDLEGGLLFAGVGGQPRGVFDPDRNNFQPRFGLAYKVLKSDRLVFRSGFGRYFLPTIEDGTEYGFSQTTQSQVSAADYLPFDVLSNPFPRGLIQPPGSSLGLATQVGQSISYMDPRRVIPSVWQYSAGFQYQPVSNLLVEISYVGSRTEDLQVSEAINFLTVQQLALGTPALSAVVNNPFYGVLPAATSLGAQPRIQARSLMTPYPQFPGLTNTTASLGEMWYNSLQWKVERRFSRGLSFLGSYTYSKTMQALSYRNAQDTALDRRLTPFDRTHRLVVSGVYEPPFGPGKGWNNRGPVSLITRGWQMSWTAIIQSGTPFNFASGYTLMGDPRLQSGQSLTKWFNTAPNLWVPNPPDTLQLTPVVSSTIRIHTAPQLDLNLVRNFHIRENHRVQCRVSAFNFTNTPIFGAPNTSPSSNLFGIVPVVQTNVPRNIELGFRYVF